ncbi:MAG: hypothetical protein FJY95_02410 [Candidatus Handelsmanbacteria bacterium]|nr:hypothetical protein [Candidatus Handelsmanbacteria bacterium]
MKINGRSVPIVTVEIKLAGNGPAAIIARKQADTFIDNLTTRMTVPSPPSSGGQDKGRRLNIVA